MRSVSATPSTHAEPNLAPAAGVVRALERKHVDVDLVPACMSSVSVAECALANMQCAPYCVKHRGTRQQRLRLSVLVHLPITACAPHVPPTQMHTAAQFAMMRSIKRHGSKRGGTNGASWMSSEAISSSSVGLLRYTRRELCIRNRGGCVA